MKKALFVIVALGAAACGGSSGTTGSSGSTTAGTASNGSATATNGSTTSGSATATNGTATNGTATNGTGTTSGGGSASASNGGTATATTGAPTTWAATVLIDNDGNDGYAANPPTDDFSLGFYEKWLTGQDTGEPALSPTLNPYLYAEPSDGSNTNNPTYQNLNSTPTTRLVWFTADFYGDYETISNAQDSSLVAWLQTGGKTLVIFAPTLFYDRGTNGWAGPETDTLLASFAVGDANNPDVLVSGSDTDIEDLNSTVVVTGGSNTYFTGKSWSLVAGEAASQYAGTSSYNVKFFWGAVNPVAGADVLATIQADPTEAGTANAATPVIVGVKNATVGGMATTSTVVYVGVMPENINNGLATNSMQDLFAAIQQYAGF